MALETVKRAGFAALIFAAGLAAQERSAPIQPAFKVVSIHEVPPNAPPVVIGESFTPVLPGGRYVNSRTSLSWLIAFAYNVKFLDFQIVGLPGWAKDQVYSVAAEPSQNFRRFRPLRTSNRCV